MAIENTTTVKAVTSGTQLSSVGTVKTVVGLVKAVDTNGVERVLQVGDKVYASETIITSADGGVIVEFQNGSFLDLPRSAHIMLDPEIYSANAAKSIEQDASDEAARIAKAIAEGRDPNAEAAPAAAGGETGDEGTTTPLVIDFDNTQGLVNSGYPTGPISLAFPPIQEELPPVIETAVVLPTVVVIVVPPDGEDEGIEIVGSVANIIEGTQFNQEGEPETRPVTFQFQLVDAAGNPYPLVHDPVTVTYHLENGTAVYGDDYIDGGLGPFTITIPSGSNTYDVTINIVQDGNVENNQAFSIVLDSATGATIGSESSFTVNIINDDNVQFAITVASEDGSNDTVNGLAVISEENEADNLGTFTISKSGGELVEGNTASVTVTLSGTTENGDDLTDDFTAAVLAAIEAGATAANVGYVLNGNGTVTLTWTEASTSDDVLVNLTATNDDATDSPESLILTLNNETVSAGSATLVSGDESATLTINDIDAAVTFAVTVASEVAGNDTPNGLAVISEENDADDKGTFTIAKGGDALTDSNTASVTITVSGLLADADFEGMTGTDYADIIAAIQTAAEAANLTVTNVDGDSLTVTWGAGDPASFNVDLTAFNDTLLDSGQSLVLTLSGETVTEGSATLVSGDESAQLTIVDTDAPPPNILDGVMKTNTNQTNQFITLGWVDQDDPRFASAKIYDLNLQGQQGTVLQDVGFDIDPSLNSNYLATFEASSGTKAIVTDLSLEGVLIQGSGNAQLQLDNTSATNSTSTAFTAVINPDDTTTPTYDGVSVQGKLLSTDGDELTNLLSADNDLNTVDYIYGAGGTDTLTGSAGSEILNGGAGLDTLNGAGGNDILVYDNVSNDAIDGGAGFDLLRIDDGALALSLAGSSSNSNTLDSGDNVTVNLSGKNIHNIEGVLITEEAGASTSGIDPNDDVGTTLVITAQDVFDYTDSDHVLYVLGNPGDKLDIDLGQWSTDNTVNADGFIAYTATVNSTTVTLMVEDTTQITVV